MSTGPSRRRARRRRTEPMETPEYAQMLKRLIRRYGVRVGEADEIDLATMLELRAEFDEAIRIAVIGQKDMGRSWAQIATGLGTTKQAVWQRFGTSTSRLSEV